jgi:hypothetical protein
MMSCRAFPVSLNVNQKLLQAQLSAADRRGRHNLSNLSNLTFFFVLEYCFNGYMLGVLRGDTSEDVKQ